MDFELAEHERAWFRQLRAEDDERSRVISYNYDFERYHGILEEDIRASFMQTQKRIVSSLRISGTLLAYELYRDSIKLDRSFWTAGERVTIEFPLAMVKHGRVIYYERWSFLSGLPEDPDEDTIASALGADTTIPTIATPDPTRLRIAAEISHRLWTHLDSDQVRRQINDELEASGLGALITPDDARSRDSHEQYQSYDPMTAGGYIPIWWVTTADALRIEFERARGGEKLASIAAIALGLSGARPGPYYLVTLPPGELAGHPVHKPTVLSGGFANNFCAVTTKADPGMTARLATGQEGVVEAVMTPLPTVRGGHPLFWPALEPLGLIDGPVPSPNVNRIRERLSIGTKP